MKFWTQHLLTVPPSGKGGALWVVVIQLAPMQILQKLASDRAGPDRAVPDWLQTLSPTGLGNPRARGSSTTFRAGLSRATIDHQGVFGQFRTFCVSGPPKEPFSTGDLTPVRRRNKMGQSDAWGRRALAGEKKPRLPLVLGSLRLKSLCAIACAELSGPDTDDAAGARGPGHSGGPATPQRQPRSLPHARSKTLDSPARKRTSAHRTV
jgi:hypothetical protein